MFTNLPLFPEQASAVSGSVDGVFFLVLGVTLFFTTLIAVLLIYFAVKYRRRSDDYIPRPVKGSYKLEVLWTAVPLAINLVIFYWGASVYFRIAQPPADADQVYVAG